MIFTAQGMDRYRPTSRLAPALIVAGLSALLALYVAGYFIGSETAMNDNKKQRGFSAAWQAKLYRPAAQVESAIIGIPVEAAVVWNTVGGPGIIGPFPPIRCYFTDDDTLLDEGPHG
jgi:hypothetical protein